MENGNNQKAQEALKTLSLIKKVLRTVFYCLVFGVLIMCIVVIYRQENYIQQLDEKVENLNIQIVEQDNEISKLKEKADQFVQGKMEK